MAGRSTLVVHSGSWSMRAGIENWWENVNSYSSATQWVDIPANATSAVLRFWYYPFSGDLRGGDRQRVFLYDIYGNLLARVLDLASSNPASNSQTWHSLQYDVTAYRGQRIRIYISCYNDGQDGITRLYVDDVALQVCTGATPVPPSPTATYTPAPVTATPTATPTQTPLSQCDNVIVNPSFESDDGWTTPPTAWSAGYSTLRAHSGSRSMRLGLEWGNPNVYSNSAAKQTITLPSTASSATLRFWYYPISGDAYDGQYCWILNTYGHVLAEPLRLRWPNSNSQAWTLRTYDLTPFLGQTVRIHFEVFNNGSGGITTMYVDDVTVEVCP